MHRNFRGGSGFVPQNQSLVAPIRAAYYFPWYDEGWNQFGYTPFTRYTPTLGYYNQDDPEILGQHFAWAKYAHLDAFICIWRGRDDGLGFSATHFNTPPEIGQLGTDLKIRVMLDQALQWGIKICIYYEVEGYANPTAAEIEAEFDWLDDNYWNHPAYLHVGGKPVVFVYSPGEGSTMLARYSTATAGYTTAYLNIIYNTGSSPAPQGRHNFPPTHADSTGNTYTIVPGWWRIDHVDPITTRDVSRWQTDIANMVASGKDWQVIISWNEWGEGSQIEPTVELGQAELDALAAVP